MRKKIVAGNWKMNNNLEEGKKLALEVAEKTNGSEVAQVVLGVPFIHLTAVSEAVAGKNGIEIAAQNCSDKDSGAYTGCLLYTSPSPRDQRGSRMPSSA